MKTLDARGLSCPEPVIMIRKAMMSKENAYEITVDNVTSRENVTRAAKKYGYEVTAKDEGNDVTRLELRK